MPLDIIQIPVLKDNYNYLLHDQKTGQTAVVDPSVAEPVLEELNRRNWQLSHILNTHHHWDHTGGNLKLKKATGCEIYGYGPDASRIPGIDHKLEEGDSVQLGEASATVLFVPGHTLGHIAYYFPKEQALFCGDTVFSMGCGRLFEGTPQQMFESFAKLRKLPLETRLYCAHEYTQANGEFTMELEPENSALKARMQEVAHLRDEGKPTVPSTLKQELDTNPFFRAATVDEFARIRALKDNY